MADADNDGDIDLFIGGLADAKQYGIAQPSYLLINNGTGHFTQAGPAVINLQNLGMVTSSAFADLNRDGWTDLVVTGEWMPVKIFMNNKGSFKPTDLPQSTGLWQTITITDVNGDGQADILAGNWGHNSKLFAGKNGPYKLYVKDFDHNGSVEQILCYTINGEEYTFLAKDELERPLPILKKAYLTYSEVAGKSVQYMFYDLFKDYTELKAEVLGSILFTGNGKGGFTRNDLPDECQLAPVFSFLPFTNRQQNAVLTGGNFTGSYRMKDVMMHSCQPACNQAPAIPAYFRRDAGSGRKVRDLKWIQTSGGKKVADHGQEQCAAVIFKRRD